METLPREHIWLVQTPQIFSRSILQEAYEKARSEGWIVTDDASLVERLGKTVLVVEGERTNIKITTPEDLHWARWIMKQRGHIKNSGMANL
jgi:2-C-methyl-D-erythritol 4-phosphate cytidylyltransferase